MVVAVQVQIDRQTVQTRLVLVPYPVVVQVVPLVAADVRLEVAEVWRLGCTPTAYGPQPGRRIDRDNVLPRRPAGVTLFPAVRQDFPHRVGAGRQVREPVSPIVLAIVSRPKRRLAGTEPVIVVQVQVDRPAVQTRLARVPHAVVIQVVPLVTADVRLEVPKIRRFGHTPAADRSLALGRIDRDGVFKAGLAGKTLFPAILKFFTYGVRARCQVREPERAVMRSVVRCYEGRFVVISFVVVVQIQVDRPSIRPRLVGVPYAVVIQVVPLVAADVRLEVAEVGRLGLLPVSHHGFTGNHGHGMSEIWCARIALLPPLRQYFTENVVARVQIQPERPVVPAVVGGDEGRLAGARQARARIVLAVAVQIRVDRPAVQTWLTSVPDAIVVLIVPLVAADGMAYGGHHDVVHVPAFGVDRRSGAGVEDKPELDLFSGVLGKIDRGGQPAVAGFRQRAVPAAQGRGDRSAVVDLDLNPIDLDRFTRVEQVTETGRRFATGGNWDPGRMEHTPVVKVIEIVPAAGGCLESAVVPIVNWGMVDEPIAAATDRKMPHAGRLSTGVVCDVSAVSRLEMLLIENVERSGLQFRLESHVTRYAAQRRINGNLGQLPGDRVDLDQLARGCRADERGRRRSSGEEIEPDDALRESDEMPHSAHWPDVQFGLVVCLIDSCCIPRTVLRAVRFPGQAVGESIGN